MNIIEKLYYQMLGLHIRSSSKTNKLKVEKKTKMQESVDKSYRGQ